MLKVRATVFFLFLMRSATAPPCGQSHILANVCVSPYPHDALWASLHMEAYIIILHMLSQFQLLFGCWMQLCIMCFMFSTCWATILPDRTGLENVSEN